MSETIKPGRYRHFKGKEYEVLYIATHSETREKMVVYRALYGERGVSINQKLVTWVLHRQILEP